ncbi:hypothetical protein HNQ35_000574 [Cerasibacillus quisquiliarum]|uniref:ABC transporter periplasmic binding protein yphF n=1 Tax=Cerasibacillus quisquiliarum TaxID=227865 RepID=A0A511V1N1_9BACI|nr:hypothetical protein [Cerasibacillus quisquiliarum]MBB5145382.1 hypothetical protein [Cerasibacillus quisquiliarum]GEN31818.1 hypothetical protein CQU01_20560 [Cerasibacillus quisquiliarum]
MKHKSIIIIGFILFILTGCMYPDEELTQNQVPNDIQLEMVQSAVEKYKEETNGLVPIKTKDSDTPIFEKYLIDFSLLKENHLLTEIPSTAYEKGGVYQYTIVDPEENPQVKLIDLRTAEALRKVNVHLEHYRSKHIYPPFDKKVGPEVYTLDYKKLGLDAPPSVISPFSQESLPIIISSDGQLYIDYRKDLQEALNEYKHDYKEGDDIRFLLVEHSPFVPAYSLPYTVKNNEPIFLNE